MSIREPRKSGSKKQERVMYDLSSLYTDLSSSSLPLPSPLSFYHACGNLLLLSITSSSCKAASSTTFITHFRSHLATFQTLCHLLGGLKLGEESTFAKREKEIGKESCQWTRKREKRAFESSSFVHRKLSRRIKRDDKCREKPIQEVHDYN